MGRQKQADAPDRLNISSAYIQSLPVGHETGEAVPSALLFMDHERYVFNCGEGFQRCCVENKIRMTKLNGILLTRISFSACSGLPGTILTLADGASASRAPLTVYGPRNLGNFMNATASYNEYTLRELQLDVQRGSMQEFGRDCSSALCQALPEPVVKTDAITIHAFLLLPSKATADAPSGAPGASREPAAAVGGGSGADTACHGASALLQADVGLAPEGTTLTAGLEPSALPSANTTDGAEPQAKRLKLDHASAAQPGAVAEDCAAASAEPLPPQGAAAMKSDAGERAPAQQPGLTGAEGLMAMCYVCVMVNPPGKFLPQKALDLGVPRGPLFGALTRGESVQTASGTTVTPAMCMEGHGEGEIAVVVDCPSAAHLPALDALLPMLAPHLGDAAAARPRIVVHVTPADVAAMPEYLAWIARLPQCQHLLCGFPFDVLRDPPSLRSSCALQVKLNLLCPTLFPLPAIFSPPLAVDANAAAAATDDRPAAAAAEATTANGQEGGRSPVSAQLLARFVLRPVNKRGFDTCEVPPALSVESIREGLHTDNADAVQAAAGAAAASAAGAEGAVALPPAVSGPDVFEFVFLGTGAAMPSKYRNVTSIYLDFFSKGGMLLDCGEGTLGQLRRRFGRAGAEARLRELRCVWISHIHADHHVGLPAVLEERARLLGPSAPWIPLFGPYPLRKVLSACSRISPLRYHWIDQYHLTPRTDGAGRDLDFFWDRLAGDAGVAPLVAGVKDTLGLAGMRSVLVDHCKHAFGVVLEAQSGWKFAFSGDTQRCDTLAAAAAGATVLVHEATFENELAADARHKKHSTIADALEVGRQAGCHSLVLTHFSQRYPRVPVLSDASNAATGIAFDMMSVNLANLHALPAVMPVLERLFKDEEQAQLRAAVDM